MFWGWLGDVKSMFPACCHDARFMKKRVILIFPNKKWRLVPRLQLGRTLIPRITRHCLPRPPQLQICWGPYICNQHIVLYYLRLLSLLQHWYSLPATTVYSALLCHNSECRSALFRYCVLLLCSALSLYLLLLCFAKLLLFSKYFDVQQSDMPLYLLMLHESCHFSDTLFC